MERRTELDTLRGLFLIVMTITHLPTHFSQYSSHLFGFVSAAEGFVFLSAFLIGKIYMRKMNRSGVESVRESLMQRARQLYSWHLGLILFAFTIATLLALMGGRPALHNMLEFYIQKPVSALLGAPLLLYQPPLLDILPMYVVFIALTPGILAFALRRGWTQLLALSALLWLFAQFDGRLLMLQAVNWLTHLDIAPNALGAFDWFAWQALWIAALWAGARTSIPPGGRADPSAAEGRSARGRRSAPSAFRASGRSRRSPPGPPRAGDCQAGSPPPFGPRL